MTAYLPQHEGLLPYFLIYSGIAALIHSVFTYLRPLPALKQFSGPSAPPPTTLLAHVYGTKNLYTGLIRLYAAYHITNPQLYDLASWTFAGVLILYVGELAVWRTVRAKEGVFPVLTSVIGLLWMGGQRGGYLL